MPDWATILLLAVMAFIVFLVIRALIGVGDRTSTSADDDDGSPR